MAENERIHLLKLEIAAEVDHFQRLKADVRELNAQFSGQLQLPVHDLRGVAMLLTEIYLGAENLMLRIAKSLRETTPSGSSWHKDLLEQFAHGVTDVRPNLFSPDTALYLDEFRRFRHVSHHVYSFDYDWGQMRRLLSKSDSILDMLITDAMAFDEFLSLMLVGDD